VVKKNILYYTNAAIIVIFAGIYMFHLPYFLHARIRNNYTFPKYFPYFIMVLMCLVDVIKIASGPESNLMKYGKLPEEEKKLYNISKVKMTQILYFLSLTIVTVFSFIFTELYPNVIPYQVLLVCYLVELVILFIFAYTKWVLNWFCRNRLVDQL
jgi:hypothetical protein